MKNWRAFFYSCILAASVITASMSNIVRADDAPVPRPLKKPDIANALISKHDTYLLHADDIKAYKRIFALQEAGKNTAADKVITALDNDVLMGYVLMQRYLHPTAYVSTFDELRQWLRKYYDIPGAQDIYELAEHKRPAGNNASLKSPQNRVYILRKSDPSLRPALSYTPTQTRNAEQKRIVASTKSQIIADIRGNRLQKAYYDLTAIYQKIGLDPVEHDSLQARIAAAHLYQGELDRAYALSAQVSKRSGLYVPLSGWTAGLVAWLREDYHAAAIFFESVGRSNYASTWMRAGGAYWAARSHMRLGNVDNVSIWLQRAASNPRTFYGMIANRALGRDEDFYWAIPQLTETHRRLLTNNKRAKRAMALVDINEISKAQAEILRIDARKNKAMPAAILTFAMHADLPAVAMRLGANPHNAKDKNFKIGAANETVNGRTLDAALYPQGPWKPFEDFKIDPALIYAMVRQESRFNPLAKSGSGAKGLMQLMPNTARSVSKYREPQMFDPEVNLELGQRYVLTLTNSRNVGNDVLNLLVAYNAGPGNLAKWRRQWAGLDDSLLFIELIPSSETRNYVERVLTNYWIYRLREDQSTPTLDALVSGQSAIWDNDIAQAD